MWGSKYGGKFGRVPSARHESNVCLQCDRKILGASEVGHSYLPVPLRAPALAEKVTLGLHTAAFDFRRMPQRVRPAPGGAPACRLLTRWLLYRSHSSVNHTCLYPNGLSVLAVKVTLGLHTATFDIQRMS